MNDQVLPTGIDHPLALKAQVAGTQTAASLPDDAAVLFLGYLYFWRKLPLLQNPNLTFNPV